MTFEAVAAQARAAEQRLSAFDKKLDNPRFFRPVIKAEWDRAFDRREALKTQLCRMDPERFASLYPNEPNDRHL
jgi:hypothetical protein